MSTLDSPPQQHKIFFSRIHEDEDIAGSICNWLNNAFVKNLHFNELEPGESWYNGINDELDSSQVFISLITRESFHRQWIIYELAYTIGRKRSLRSGTPVIIPLFVDVNPIDSEVELLSHIHGYELDSSKDNSKHCLTILEKVKEATNLNYRKSLGLTIPKRGNLHVNSFINAKKHLAYLSRHFSTKRNPIIFKLKNSYISSINDLIDQNTLMTDSSYEHVDFVRIDRNLASYADFWQILTEEVIPSMRKNEFVNGLVKCFYYLDPSIWKWARASHLLKKQNEFIKKVSDKTDNSVTSPIIRIFELVECRIANKEYLHFMREIMQEHADSSVDVRFIIDKDIEDELKRVYGKRDKLDFVWIESLKLAGYWKPGDDEHTKMGSGIDKTYYSSNEEEMIATIKDHWKIAEGNSNKFNKLTFNEIISKRLNKRTVVNS